MSGGGLDWRKAKMAGKRQLSTRDETEFRDKDAAARWLARNEKPKGKKRHHPAPHGFVAGREARA